MTEEDPFLRDFGISTDDLHVRLTMLEKNLRVMAEDISQHGNEVTLEHLVFSTIELALFLADIPAFAKSQLMNCQDLVARDLDRIGKGSPAIVIRPPDGNSGRPESDLLFQAAKGWAAAYMELLHRSKRTIGEASEKAARDIDGRGWRFAGGPKGGDHITASRVRSWRNQCTGFTGKPNAMTETYRAMIELADQSGRSGESAAAMILDHPIRP